jgi:hypothetical protein
MSREEMSNTIKDRTLQAAWQKMFNYDLQAVDAQRSFRRSRLSLVAITTISTIAASVATFFVDDSRGVAFISLAFVALIFPIVGNGLISYIQRFENIMIWLKHRLIAERMRSEIYQYRMKAGEYAKLPAHKHDNHLNTVIHETEKMMTNDEFKAAKYEAHIAKEWRNMLFEHDQDYGEELSFDDYLRIRCTNQKNWYNGRIHKNYKKTKQWTAAALIIQGAGAALTGFALLSGIGDPRWIIATTITNAISFAINSWINIDMIGQLYGLFDMVQKQLSYHEGEWYASSDDPEYALPEKLEQLKIDMVDRVEATLALEREEWYRVALQTLSSNDQALFKAVEELYQKDSDGVPNGSNNGRSNRGPTGGVG